MILEYIVTAIHMLVLLVGIRRIVRLAYLCIRKREPVVIAAVSIKHLPEAERDIKALRLTYSTDQIVEVYHLEREVLKDKLQAYSNRKIYLHIGCHCDHLGRMQFDNEMVEPYDIASIMPHGGVDTIVLMCCYGGMVAPHLLGENAAKNILYTEYDHEIDNASASAITRVFWQEMKRSYGHVRSAYLRVHETLSDEICQNIRLSRYTRSDNILFRLVSV